MSVINSNQRELVKCTVLVTASGKTSACSLIMGWYEDLSPLLQNYLNDLQLTGPNVP